jgi:asparagine synthase (glutamine-hydrolysing)
VKGISLETRLALTGSDRVHRADQRLSETFAYYFRRVGTTSALNRMLYADAKVWLPEDLLLKADKMTMATAVELRVPFLDHKLVEFLAALPDDAKVRGNQGKWILRQALGSVLPPSILHRKKKGFPIPAETWFQFELRDFVRDTLLARNSACREFFEPQAISGHQEVWSLLVFESWHKQFITGFVPAHANEKSAVEVDVFAGRGA